MSAAYRIVASIDGHSWKIEQSYVHVRSLFAGPSETRWTTVAGCFETIEEAEAAIKRVVDDRGRYYDSHGRPL